VDPTANLKEQLEITHQMLNKGWNDTDAVRLAELVEALHEWISKGGFLPKQWRKKEE
jgi:hypothetical protein